MRNKKSVLMTLNHNCGCFSGVGYGIAPNVSAMSSGGFRTTHYQNTTNDNRKQELTK